MRQSNPNTKPVRVYLGDCIKDFSSIGDTTRWVLQEGISKSKFSSCKSNIQACLYGRTSKAYGLKFEYITTEDVSTIETT